MKYAVKTYGRMDVHIHVLLISARDGCEWLPSRYGRHISGETLYVPIA
jgi:hypothetical protein